MSLGNILCYSWSWWAKDFVKNTVLAGQVISNRRLVTSRVSVQPSLAFCFTSYFDYSPSGKFYCFSRRDRGQVSRLPPHPFHPSLSPLLQTLKNFSPLHRLAFWRSFTDKLRNFLSIREIRRPSCVTPMPLASRCSRNHREAGSGDGFVAVTQRAWFTRLFS